jgi:hypothetical protein
MFDLLYSYTLGQSFNYLEQFSSDVFLVVGIVSLVVALALCLIYYLIINRMTDKAAQLVHWIVFLVLAILICGVHALVTGTNYMVDVANDVDTPLPILFWLMNAIYGGVYFFLLSILFKKASKYATKVPF